MPGALGVLLLQLGTPDAPTTPALRRYLRQFLSDRRVIDLPRALWWPILNFIVLRRRPPRSAALYRKVWTDGGSPLLVTSRAQAAALQQRLQARASRPVVTAVAMRYGNPSTEDAVEELIRQGADRIVVLPMYPQYASATTGSSLEELFAVLARRRVIPPVRIVAPYFDDEGYIEALAAVTREALDGAEPPQRIVVSFHGLPRRYVDLGDPYQQHCEATAKRLTAALGLPEDRVMLVYQSRFGREPWLQPYADDTIKRLPSQGVTRIAVMCPGFTADCLETIEEMGMTNRELFEHAGGRGYVMVPCVNEHPVWLDAMARLVGRDAPDWLQSAAPGEAATVDDQRAAASAIASSSSLS